MITLDKEISTIGGWSTIYRIKDDESLCAKVLAPHRKYKKQRPDPALIALKKYGITDMLQYELINYNNIISKVPSDLLKYFVKFHAIEQTQCGQKALVMELVKNDLGEVAHNLTTNPRPLADQFFKTLERIRREVFIKNAIDHFGIACRNILVRTTIEPVIIDFQNTKARLKGQFWLNIPFFVRQKVTRKFQRVYTDLKVNDFTKIKNIDDISIR
jgi:RIO kinase 1